MTLSEFKAWFEGFTEEMSDRPTKKQWTRIKKRVKDIDGCSITERHFVDLYWRPYRDYWGSSQWHSGSVSATSATNITMSPDPDSCTTITASQALNNAGRAEYKATI